MANNFTSDANCKALWRFEDGALTADSKGTNTLTAIGTPTADTSDHKEGSASVVLQSMGPDCFSITDANLDAGFPLKSGDATKNISVCFAYKPVTSSAYHIIFSKQVSAGGKASIQIDMTSDGVIRLNIGYSNGVLWETKSYGTGLTDGKWYHVGVTFQNSTKAYRIRIWDYAANALLGSELTGTATNNINVEDAPLVIGATDGPSYPCDGKLDEMVVCSDILTAGEIDQIRAGTYGSVTTTSTTSSTTTTTTATASTTSSTTSSSTTTATASTTSSTTSTTSSTATASTTSSTTSTTATASTTSSTTSTASSTTSTTATASTTSSTSSTTSTTTTAYFDCEAEVYAIKQRLTALENKASNHDTRIAALEASNRSVFNVYDEAGVKAGGSKGVQFETRTGGVYP